MDKLLIVDGSNLLFQMFYGMPGRILGKNGKAIHGTLGFIGALRKILKMVQPTHVAVFFDGECENPRKELDVDYKANRPDYSDMEEDETPFSQLPDIYAALDYLGIAHKETQCCEADDWIAGYCSQYGKDMDIVVSSQDSDFFQLISDHVQILRYRGEYSVCCDKAYLAEKYGIAPCQYAAFKSLTGDTADNIKGAEKIGPKTAGALLRQFGDLDTLLREFDAIAKPSVRQSIEQNADRIRKNYQLIYLHGEPALPFPIQALPYAQPDFSTTQVLTAIGIR